VAPPVRDPRVNHQALAGRPEWKLQLPMIFRCLLFFISIRGQQWAVERVPAREDSTAHSVTFRGWLRMVVN
jgi:hypothetical protein